MAGVRASFNQSSAIRSNLSFLSDPLFSLRGCGTLQPPPIATHIVLGMIRLSERQKHYHAASFR